MRKYFHFTWLAFLNRIEYRMNFWWQICGTILTSLIQCMFWIAVLQSGFGNNNYTAATISLYYLFTTFVGAFSELNYGKIAHIITDGNLGPELIKPYNFFLKEFTQTIPDKIIRILLLAIVYWLLFSSGIQHTITFTQSLLAIVSVILAMISRYYIGMAMGLLGFWFKRVHGFNALFWTFGSIFSGDLVPVDLLPTHLYTVASYLPFKYFAFFPVQLMLGKSLANSELITSFLLQAIWAVIFGLICLIVWKRGLLQFDASGK